MFYKLIRRLFISMTVKRTGYRAELVEDELASIETTLSHRASEADVIEARLMRRFDPAMAWSEAINRACAAKKIARTSIFTGYQEQAFAVQQETSLRALKNA